MKRKKKNHTHVTGDDNDIIDHVMVMAMVNFRSAGQL